MSENKYIRLSECYERFVIDGRNLMKMDSEELVWQYKNNEVTSIVYPSIQREMIRRIQQGQ